MIIGFHFCFPGHGSLLNDMSRVLINFNGTGVAPSGGAANRLALLPSASQPPTSAAVTTPSNGVGSESANDIRRLQDDVNQLTKRNGGMRRIQYPPRDKL